MNSLRFIFIAISVALFAAQSMAAESGVEYVVTVSQRAGGKWQPTRETTTYKTFAEALQAVSRMNVEPDRMATYTRKIVAPVVAGPPNFVGTWIPEGEKQRGDARTGAPGVIKNELRIQDNGIVVHHDTYYGMVRCQSQIKDKTILLSHDKGWGGREPRWTFSGSLEGDKLVGSYRYVDSDGQATQVTYVRSHEAKKNLNP